MSKVSKELSEHYKNYVHISKPNVPNGGRSQKSMPQSYSTLDDFEALVDAHEESLEIPHEMFDFIKIMKSGAIKHGTNTWLDPNGPKTSEKDMHASMGRHLSQSASGDLKDKDTGLDPLLHLACRALMLYTRRQRNIKNEGDK